MSTPLKRAVTASVALGFSALVGCGTGGLPQVMDPTDVRPASGAPRITRIRDAGTAMIPRVGALEAVPDGAAGPGELLVIEGAGFGRQPTVTVGGRPAEVTARVAGDGVIVRVPASAATGLVDVSVTTSGGVARLATTIRRLAIAVFDEHVRFAAIGKDAIVPLPSTLSLPGARQVRVDSTGGIALVLCDAAELSSLSVLDLGRTEPSVLGTLSLTHRASAIAVASLAPRVAVVGDGKVTVIDTSTLRRPVLFDAAALPREVRGVRAAELSPDGRVLAVLLGEGNRLVAIDLQKPTAPVLLSTVEVLPGERQSLVRDLAFGPDGQTLWIVSGSSAETHPQTIPTRVTAARLLAAYTENAAEGETAGHPIDHLRRQLAVWKTQVVNGAGAPLAIVVGQPPEQQGSAIRTTPEAATVFVSTVKHSLLDLKAANVDLARVKKAMTANDVGMIARAELSSAGGPVATTAELLGSFVVQAAEKRAVALAIHATDGALEVGLDDIVLEGEKSARFVGLGTIDPKHVHPPFAFGDLAIQP